MGAITPTAIINMALREVGAERISDYMSDSSKEARIARDIFHPTRRWLLAQCEWNGAIKAGELDDMEAVPTFWSHAYELPDDIVRIIGIFASNDDSDGIPYELGYLAGTGDDEANTYAVMCSSNQCFIKYVCDQQDLSVMSEGFHMALTFRLAKTFAGALGRTESGKELTDKAWRRTLTIAKAIDGQEGYPAKMGEGSWMGMRFGRYGGRSTFTGA